MTGLDDPQARAFGGRIGDEGVHAAVGYILAYISQRRMTRQSGCAKRARRKGAGYETIRFKLRQAGKMDVQALNPTRLAAVVYDEDVAIDVLMSVFARELIDAGFDARGFLQAPREEVECGSGPFVVVQSVRGGDVIPICHDLHPHEGACSLDRASLAGVAARLRLDILQGSDILFISRFGREEARGAGLVSELALAIEQRCVVLTAVSRSRRQAWLAFTRGRGVLLDHRLSALRDWWRKISPGVRSSAGAGSGSANRRAKPRPAAMTFAAAPSLTRDG